MGKITTAPAIAAIIAVVPDFIARSMGRSSSAAMGYFAAYNFRVDFK